MNESFVLFTFSLVVVFLERKVKKPLDWRKFNFVGLIDKFPSIKFAAPRVTNIYFWLYHNDRDDARGAPKPPTSNEWGCALYTVI